MYQTKEFIQLKPSKFLEENKKTVEILRILRFPHSTFLFVIVAVGIDS